MRRLTPLVALLASALLAPAAYGQAGLYEPFPSPRSTGLTKRYLRQLPPTVQRQYTSIELRRGVFVARPPTAAIGAASARAGRGDDDGSLPPVLSLGIVAVAAGGGFALASRRR
jgi:hypothetical protein